MPASRSPTADASPKIVPSLTGVRGLAALWVLLFHLQMIGEANGMTLGLPGYRLLAAGWTGVDLFFLLSGFMLMHANAGPFADWRWGRVGRFLAARFVRVYPLAVASLIVVVAIVGADAAFARHFAGMSPGNLSAASFVATLTIATRWVPVAGSWNEPVWSLSAEMVGYLAFPALAFAALRVRSATVSLVVAGSAIEAVIYYQMRLGILGTNDITFQGSLVRMAGYFLAGIFLHRAATIGEGQRDDAEGSIGALAILAIVAVPLLALHPLGPGLMPIAFAVLIYSLYFRAGPIDRLLSSRAALFAGAVSFPLYLLHVMPVFWYNFHIAPANVGGARYMVGLACLAGGLIGVSWLANRFIERPCHRWARRLAAGA